MFVILKKDFFLNVMLQQLFTCKGPSFMSRHSPFWIQPLGYIWAWQVAKIKAVKMMILRILKKCDFQV